MPVRRVSACGRLAALSIYFFSSSRLAHLVCGVPSNITATERRRQLGRKEHLPLKELSRTGADLLPPLPSSPSHSSAVTHWLLLAANPRPVSFFGGPRFAHFASGRHTISFAPLQFDNLFPGYATPEKVLGGDGKLRLVVVPNLLATLVPETSPHFAAMKLAAATRRAAPYAALWRATHHPASLNMVMY